MKRILIFLSIVSVSLSALAQSSDSISTTPAVRGDSAVKLKGVTVRAARVTYRPDDRHIIPSSAQRRGAADGYDFLRLLSLPSLRVDAVRHTISDKYNRGEVQLRINGAIASKADLMTLDPRSVLSVDYIDNPGVRYGDGIACVIDIRTRRSDAGYEIGADLNQALARFGDDMVYAKYNRKNAELALSYDFSYSDNYRGRGNMTTDYLLTDGTHETVTRTDLRRRKRDIDNTVELKYTNTDTLGNVLQAKLSGAFTHSPGNDRLLDVNGTPAVDFSRDRSFSPVIDLYLVRRLAPRQTITANVVGTHINTRAYNYIDEGGPYAYHVKGRTSSLIAEAVYEYSLKPFTLSAGANYQLKYTRNRYTDDVDAVNRLHTQYLYGFTRLKGRLGRLTYVAGLGVINQRYTQGEAHYNYTLSRPMATLAYDFGHGFGVSYGFKQYGFFSRIAMISDAAIRTNGREWTVGAPNLKPNRCREHTLKFTYSVPRLNNTFTIDYRDHSHCNMAAYLRTDDDRFIYTQRNQRGIKVLSFTDDISYTLIPDKLVANVSGGFFRDFNFGDDYTHLYNFWMIGGGLEAYLGQWTLSANADNGFSFLEGETRGWNYGKPSLMCSYRTGHCTFSLTWQQCFLANPKQMSSRVLSRYMYKEYVLRSKDMGNLVTLSFAWKLGQGRSFREAKRRLNNRDTQTGIIGR